MRPSRSGRAHTLGAAGCFLSLAGIVFGSFALAKERPSPTADASPKSPSSLASMPLPIGQEAKGLVLPDFDLQGKMRGRLEAGTAKRTDADHLQFATMKLTTFTEQNTPDLFIEMPVSTLDLNTRVISSNQRTSVTRSDFTIAGDRMEFDTVSRKGTLLGNVKMVISNGSALTAAKPK